MYVGKVIKENGGNILSCVYYSNRDCFFYVMCDMKLFKVLYD